MMSRLERIVESKRQEIASLRGKKWGQRFSPRPVQLKRSANESLKLIGEIKFRSPSAGPLSTELSVAQRARAYADAGLSMVSVLCDGPFFGGSYEDLAIARQSCDAPLLCKEFIIDEVQLDAAVAHGADWVLLIARCLSGDQSRLLLKAAQARGLGVLYEIHGRQEADHGVSSGCPAIGVNARDLDTLAMDLPSAESILQQFPSQITAVHLSGLKTGADVARLRAGRADAALIGEVLMREANPARLLAELVAAAAPIAAALAAPSAASQ